MIEQLHKAEFSRFYIKCVILEDTDVDMLTLMRIRRRLRTAAIKVLGAGSPGFKRLFDPPLPDDPIAVKRYQKAAPAFVFHPHETKYKRYSAGEYFNVSVLLFGDVISRYSDFIQAFAALGQVGLRLDTGRFELEQVTAVDDGEFEVCIWHKNKSISVYAPPVLDLKWWLENRVQIQRGDAAKVTLSFCTPARLMHGKRPVFSANLPRLFPFILRRITSMLYSHCAIELDLDFSALQHEVAALKCLDNNLYWHDWRSLNKMEQGTQQPIGGLYGTIAVLMPTGYSSITGLLQLGTLVNLGKNAAYGSGSYVLEFSQ